MEYSIGINSKNSYQYIVSYAKSRPITVSALKLNYNIVSIKHLIIKIYRNFLSKLSLNPALSVNNKIHHLSG